MKSETPNTHGLVGRKRALFGVAAVAVGIIVALGWSFAPSSVTSKVSAADHEVQDGATSEMLAYALNLKSASSLAAFGGNSVRNEGSTDFRSYVGSTGEVSGVAADSLISLDYAQARNDLMDAFSAVDQLPCTQIDDGDLSGKRFGPGVYCVGSATLAGRMTVDAGGDANARFVFRIEGTFTAADASSIDREGGAVGTHVYVFARDAASIGGDASIGANVISRDSVRVGHGSTVSGKVMGVNGDVTTDSNIIAGASGYLEICKSVAGNNNPGLVAAIAPGTIFTFTVDQLPGITIQVPAGGCSPPLKVEAGINIVTEGVRADTAVVDVATTPSNRLVSSNFGLRQALVSVVEGDVPSQTVVTFTNQSTRTGTVEICKFGLDPDVTGFFNFTVQGAVGQTFSVPVGFCSGPITITLLQVGTQPFTTNVTELARVNFRLQSIATFPATSLNSTVFDAGFDASGAPLANNTNGDYANVTLNIAGGAANQTTVRFFNRSLPGRIKVCKITADPVNIPVGTTFSFTIKGPGWNTPTTAVAFMPQNFTFDVLAGPASQGGFCAFAPGLWVVGENVIVYENGINGVTNTTTLPLGLAATNAALYTSRIQASTAFVTPPGSVLGVGGTFTVNPQIGPVPGSYAVIKARSTTAEIEFTNYIYRPSILKLCKVAGAGVAVGTPFTFSIAPADPLTTLPYPTAPITVLTGTCLFINGPFPANNNFPGVGLFNFGTSIIVTENAVAGTAISTITSPTLTPIPNPNPPNFVGTLTVDIPNRRGTLTFNQILSIGPNFYFNELTFTNIAAVIAPPVARRARYDFDGDHASDIAVFRPSDGNWYYSGSSSGITRAVHFGQSGDVPVASDYDGDGITDPAVYRNGQWFLLRSNAGFAAMSFGLSTDIPMPGDFDGDGKSDIAVYRPSNGTWYIMGSTDGFRAEQFGISTDKPVTGDWDADGKADMAVYRNGTWYINMSTNGVVSRSFGIAGDIPVAADYDGDGRTDTAVYRGGTWYVMGSYDGFFVIQFGNATDTPVPADYDGDGKTDAAVYRPSTTMWYISPSGQAASAVAGVSAKQFGSAGDLLMRY